MSETPVPSSESANIAIDRAQQALRLAIAGLPHLSGLAHWTRFKTTDSFPVAAVSSSGLILVNPEVFSQIPLGDAAFVLAHELLHLALDTHGRQGDARPLFVNYAHDYIINDILREELGRDPPLGGLNMPQARECSLEELVIKLSKSSSQKIRCWKLQSSEDLSDRQSRGAISRALEDAGLIKKPSPPVSVSRQPSPGDIISDEMESQLEPHLGPQQRQRLREEIRQAAAKAVGLGEFRKKLATAGDPASSSELIRGSESIRALREAYGAKWELAMQRWMDAVSPTERSYSRPSRRSGGHADVIRPGRVRQGWTIHVILDTSGSMVEFLPRALGAIAFFCEASGVDQVRLVQCDVEVTSDLWVEPHQLAEYQVTGFGYSDMRPAMAHLADDPEVEAVLVLTDGFIDIPDQPPPYRVLFCLMGFVDELFSPPFGQVVKLTLPQHGT